LGHAPNADAVSICEEAQMSKRMDDVEEIVSNLPKPTLVAIVMEFASKHQSVCEGIIMKHSKKESLAENAKAFMKATKSECRYENYNYESARPMVDCMKSLLTKTSMYELLNTVAISAMVLKETFYLIYLYEKEELFELASEAIENIETVIEVLDDNDADKGKILDLVLDILETCTFDYFGDDEASFIEMLIPFCGEREFRARFEKCAKHKSKQYILTKIKERFGEA
jgi:hypothetical protein